ncbi:MAG: transposase [Boseongicola sp. SB0677_bin_26]|nr:transposase [Boseongicola sp. SB0665_bin_10]MYG25572.1 transposase [Boseongicola sp. SB0677_bin_26]
MPRELVFDSRLTTYANLDRLGALGIAFITLRRRTPKLVAELLAAPAEEWRRITLTNVGRIYRKPRILDRRVTLKPCAGELRQITVTDLGHERPALLITNQTEVPARELVDRYAHRMVIENTIADAIDFFHMDALSAAVPLKVHLDLQVTLMASALYRTLARRLGNGMENAHARTLFRKVVNTSATIDMKPEEIVVSLGRRANNPLLIAAGFAEQRQPIPWLGDRRLRIRFF